MMAVDPELMMGIAGENEELRSVAEEAGMRLRRVVLSLAEGSLWQLAARA